MSVVEIKSQQPGTKGTSQHITHRSLNITLCPPELYLLKKVMEGEVADATFIIQAYITEGLQNRNHLLNFVGSYYSEGPVYSGELDKLEPARLAWTGSALFEFVRKLVWQIQRMLRIPYLNLFSNLRLLDACIKILPGQDIVYERNFTYRFGMAMACNRLEMPYVLYVEADDILEHDIMKKPITGLLRLQAAEAFRYNLNSADRVICVSEPLKAHLVKKWNIPAEKIVVFPNVADVERFKPDKNARDEIRVSLGIGDAPMILFVGNFYEWHDVNTLLRAFVDVLKERPDARLVLVGDGTKRKDMVRLAQELELDSSVIFTGMVSHKKVPNFMASADVAVVPYPILEQDVWLSPLKLFEYMASGNAIIASNVGQLSEWITNEHNGLLVSPGDISGMSAGIGRLLSDSHLRTQLGKNARIEAVRKHSWDRYLSDLESVFYSVLKTGKGL